MARNHALCCSHRLIGALDAAGSAVESAYAAVVNALTTTGTPKKLRTEEAEVACNATAMDGDSNHPILSDPLFESIFAAMESQRNLGTLQESLRQPLLSDSKP